MTKIWKIKLTGGGTSAKIVDGMGTVATIIRTSRGTPAEKLANAKLIAAAPILHNALESIVKVGKDATAGHDKFCQCSTCIIVTIASTKLTVTNC